MKKKELEIILAQLTYFDKPKVSLEQYPTDAKIVADLLWNAHTNRHLKGKVIADLGCGPGTFGLGAMLMGAKKVYLLDIDPDALKIAKKNKAAVEKIMGKKINVQLVQKNVREFDQKVNVVLQNPPFGVKKTHHDKLFLVRAMELAPVVYSFHKLSTQDFVERVAEDSGFRVRQLYTYALPIKQSFWFHTSRMKYVDVGCWCLTKR